MVPAWQARKTFRTDTPPAGPCPVRRARAGSRLGCGQFFWGAFVPKGLPLAVVCRLELVEYRIEILDLLTIHKWGRKRLLVTRHKR